MKNLLVALVLSAGIFSCSGSPASAAPLVCSGSSGLVYVLAASCASANVGVFPGFTVGNCLVVQSDFSLGGGACGGGGGGGGVTSLTAPVTCFQAGATVTLPVVSSAGFYIGSGLSITQVPAFRSPSAQMYVTGIPDATHITALANSAACNIGHDYTPGDFVGYAGLNHGDYLGTNGGQAVLLNGFTMSLPTTGTFFQLSTADAADFVAFNLVGSATTGSLSIDPSGLVLNSGFNTLSIQNLQTNSSQPITIGGNPVAPTLNSAGGQLAHTYTCITTPAAGLTAVGGSTAVAFPGGFTFAGAYTLFVNDNTVLSTVPPVTAKSTTGFTFTSVNTHVYSFQACGE